MSRLLEPFPLASFYSKPEGQNRVGGNLWGSQVPLQVGRQLRVSSWTPLSKARAGIFSQFTFLL